MVCRSNGDDDIMQTTQADQPRDRRCRDMHPERIVVGDTTFERNDITAKRYGITERTLNNGDKEGAPYQYFGNIKYRPIKAHDAHVLARIRSQRPPQPQKRRRTR
jgi:hypothetical protein